MTNRVLEKISTDFQENIVKTTIVLAVVATIYLFSGGIFLSFVLGVAVGVILLGWDSRLFIGLALFFLITCPVLLALDKQALAEEMAVDAYYMLALGVILQLIEYFKESLVSGETKAVESPEPIELWSKKKAFLMTVGVNVLIMAIFAGGFSYFYLKIEKQLNQNNQLIINLMNTREKKDEQVVSETKEEDVTLIDYGEIELSILNGSTISGVARKLGDEMSKDGFTVSNVDTAEKDDYQTNLIKYAPDSLEKAKIVNEYLTASYSEIELQEDPELTTDVEIILGNL